MPYSRHQPVEFEDIKICSISFNMTDRIRLIGLPIEEIPEIRTAITLSWGDIQNERDYYSAYEFKLSGNPWNGKGEDAVNSRKLLASILRTMARFGWNLLQAADVSKKSDDNDTLFFEMGTPDPDVSLFAMSFNMNDKIRIIDAPSFVPCVKEAILSQWSPGIQNESNYCGAMEFKLSGTPWYPNGEETVTARMLLCQIIANVRAKGFKLYGSVGISIGHEGMYLESWIFRRVDGAWK